MAANAQELDRPQQMQAAPEDQVDQVDLDQVRSQPQ